MAKSRMKHKQPIMGSLHTPYRETGMRDFGLYPWWAFCMENIKNKQIIILVGIIFLAFVAYKIIASNVQQSKEEAVLQKQYQLQELAKEPLNQCLDDVDKRLNNQIAIFTQSFYESYTPEYKTQCENLNSHVSSTSFLLNKSDCRPISQESLDKIKQEETGKAEIEKQDCYKRYK